MIKKILFALLALAAVKAYAGQQIILGAMQTVTGGAISNSTPITVGTIVAPQGTLIISHGALATTNDLAFYIQETVDGVNYTNVLIGWHPSSTNAGSDIVTVPLVMPPLVFRGQVTNSTAGPLTYGGTFTQ